ncbi:MAG: response regulator transcription factor [Pseudomonadota bacterium]
MLSNVGRVIVVDDHEIFLDGIRLLLSTVDESIDVVTASDASTALDLLDSDTEVDLILLDMSMPNLDGLQFLNALQHRNQIVPVIVLSATENIRKIKSALDAGALGFIPKSFGGPDILAAINTVLSGQLYLPSGMDRHLAALERDNADQASEKTNDHGLVLTRRQVEVLELLSKGYSNKQIATVLFLSENTVKTHVTRLFADLSVDNRTACVSRAQELGLL